MLDALHTILFLCSLIPFAWAFYLLCLTLFAWLKSGQTQDTSRSDRKQNHSFLFLIPAHNEEKLLPTTIDNLLNDIAYQPSKYEVVVIADNCTDQTAALALTAGAEVFERNDLTQKGKGYALTWGLEQCWTAGKNPDAVIILDADTVVSRNFLQAIAFNLEQGHRVIQSFYSVLNATESWSAGLRYAALSVLHFVRPLGRSLYGGSAGLKGNGMVFTSDILKNHTWSSSITEDIEFHMDLLLQGEVVHFSPNAIVWAEMPNTLETSASQNRRWETGRLEMAKRYVPQLIQAALFPNNAQKRNTIPQLDAVMEHIIPPFAIFNAISLGLFVLALIVYVIDQNNPLASINLWGTISILVIQLVYLFSGLKLTNADRSVYKNLLYAPIYIFWKTLLALRIVTDKTEEDWVRTTRNETT